ncbi:MAG: hypothetical protein ACTSRU_13015 [Candidatus Hodarchaeales archaeon]
MTVNFQELKEMSFKRDGKSPFLCLNSECGIIAFLVDGEEEEKFCPSCYLRCDGWEQVV